MARKNTNTNAAIRIVKNKINRGGVELPFILILLLCFCMPLKAQQIGCGTVCTPEMAAHIQVPSTAVPFGQRATIEVPIKIHVVCSGSSNSSCYDQATIDNALAYLNTTYAAVPMHFYECGGRDFIYNSPYYDFERSIANQALLAADYDVRKAINIYFVNTISGSAVGFTTLPTDEDDADRIFITRQGLGDNLNHIELLLAHEMGHYFGVFHTNGGNTSGTTDELVNGSNCAIAGDQICDTPADPAKIEYLAFSATACLYPFGSVISPISCPNFCDANGQIYTPLGNNIMFYTYCDLGSFNTFTAGQLTRIYNGYNTYRTYLDGSGDLVLRDNVSDVGIEPNYQSDDILGWNDIWQSPDLWNRTSQPNLNNAADRVHQNPEFNATATNYNYLCARITNRGCSATPIGASIQLYWTRARSGEVWPTDWYGWSSFIDDNTPNLNCDVSPSGSFVRMGAGAEVTTQVAFNPNTYTTSNNNIFSYESTPIAIPALNPGASYYVAQPWIAPDPHCYDLLNIDQNVSTEWPMICFLTRLTGPNDLINNELNGVVTNNVIKSNNIVTRNSAMVDLLPGGVQEGKIIKLLIENVYNYQTTININLANLTKSDVSPFLAYGKITLIVNQAIWDKWVAGGSQSDGLQTIKDRYFNVADPRIARLKNINLLANEKQDIGVLFSLNGSGKAPLQLSKPTEYSFLLTHQSTSSNENEKEELPSGGGLFKVTIHPNTKTGLSQQTHLVAFPNPTNGITFIQYWCDQAEPVTITLSDASGHLVKTLLNKQPTNEGIYDTTFDATNLPKGIYFCTLSTPTQQHTTKIILTQ